MSYPVSADGVSAFISFLVSKGLMPENTAGGIRTACDRVFSALAEDERANLVGLDVSSAVKRFVNKNPGVLSPSSANVYRSRVQRGLTLLDRFNADPTSFKIEEPKKKNGTSLAEVKNAARARPPESTQAKGQDCPSLPSQRDANVVGAVSLTLPLRADFVAQFIVPRDLTSKEARRLGAYFATVAIDYDG